MSRFRRTRRSWDGLRRGRVNRRRILPCPRAFENRVSYDAFVEKIAQRLKARVEKRLTAEWLTLRPLPPRRTAEFDETTARVSKYDIYCQERRI